MVIYTFTAHNDNDCELITKVYKNEDEAKKALNKAYEDAIDAYYCSDPSTTDMCEKGDFSAYIIGNTNFAFRIEKHEI